LKYICRLPFPQSIAASYEAHKPLPHHQAGADAQDAVGVAGAGIPVGIAKTLHAPVKQNKDALQSVDTLAEFARLLPLDESVQNELVEKMLSTGLTLTMFSQYDTPEELFLDLVSGAIASLKSGLAAQCTRYLFALKNANCAFTDKKGREI
jgi:hypothetical protein